MLQVSYLRCVFLAPNKAVFDVTTINIPDFSASVGLLVAPKLRFLKKAGKGTAWNAGAGLCGFRDIFLLLHCVVAAFL